MEIENVERSATRSDETTIQLICDDIMFFMKLQLLEITIEDNILLSENAKKIIMERYYVIAQERVRAIYVDTRMTIHNAWEIYRSIYTREDDIKLLKFIISDCLFQEAHVVKTEIQDSTSVASPPVDGKMLILINSKVPIDRKICRFEWEGYIVPRSEGVWGSEVLQG